MWDENIDGYSASEEAKDGTSLEEYPGVVFDRQFFINETSVYPHSFYVADFNNDGYRELCIGFAIGSGFIDERIMIFDYHNDKTLFELNDRFNHDYYLYINKDILCVRETASMNPDNQTRIGEFIIDKSSEEISILWKEDAIDNTKYYLAIIDSHQLITEQPHLINQESDNGFKAGDVVYFKTSVIYDADVVARFNGVKLVDNYIDIGELEFSFTMPAKSSILEITIEGSSI